MMAMDVANMSQLRFSVSDLSEPDWRFRISDLAVGGGIGIALGQRSLDFNRALGCFQRTPEFDQERVTDCFYFSAVKPRKDFPKQPAMFLQQFLGKLFVALAQRAVAHHVGEHDGGEFALFVGVTHFNWSMARPLHPCKCCVASGRRRKISCVRATRAAPNGS